MLTRLKRTPNLLVRSFSTSTTNGDFKMSDEPEKPLEPVDKSKDKSSILHIDNAVKHCTAEVKKFDFYTFVAG